MFNFMSFGENIGIDLGTATVLVYIKGQGIVIREPSVVAIDKDTNTILAVGEEARRMLGRTPGNIVAIRPLSEGVISNYGKAFLREADHCGLRTKQRNRSGKKSR